MPCRKNDYVIITELEREETEASLRYQAEAENAKTKNFEVQNYHLGMRKRTNFYSYIVHYLMDTKNTHSYTIYPSCN